MQVLPCTSDVHYTGESNNLNQGSENTFMCAEGANSVKHELVEGVNTERSNAESSDDEQFGEPDESRIHNNEPSHELDVDDSNTRDSVLDSLDGGNHECESSRPEPKWLEQDQPMAVWVKWRGKWQAAIRCARSDWPLSTIRAKPTHDRKQYLVIFFLRKKTYSWADVLLLRPINQYPEPIAYRSHKVGVKVVKDLTVARRFIVQKIAVSMINTIEQLTTEALNESARSVGAWKDFALEASKSKNYSDLGNMLLKLENMILRRFIDSHWLEHSLEKWVQQCQNARSAECIEILKEELVNAITFNEMHVLSNSSVQPEVSSEWKIVKPEVMKWFSMSNPSFNTENTEQKNNNGFSNPGLQVSRKRPKLEIRRAEVTPAQLETDSRFFYEPVGPSSGEVSILGTTEPDRWSDIVVEAGNNQETRFVDLETTPLNKNKQCAAFIEAKGRQCVRWANDGDAYCCVHVTSRFSPNSVKMEVTPQPLPLSTDAHLCDGITVLGTKCKHRPLPGSTSCKKHRSNKDTLVFSTPPPENKLKRKLEDESRNLQDFNTCKEIVISSHFGTQVAEESRNEYNDDESLHCVGDGVACNEAPTRHTLYCDKHLPNWLKRARNGKSRIISKEVFIELLKSCESYEQKLHLHQACELFYKFFKSVLSLRSPVPKEIQLQWVISEASKDVNTRHFLMKLVYSEKERLVRLWGFNGDTIERSSSSIVEPVNLMLTYNNEDSDEGIIIKCNICSVEFHDDQMLAKHWVDNHKTEAESVFKRYVCAICLDSFTKNEHLEAHVHERHHVEFVEQCMLYQCIPCGSRFGNPDQLWAHVVTNHPTNFRQLQNQTGNQIQVQSNVNSSDNGLQRFICRFCGSRFDLLPDLGRHHQAVHMGSNSNLNPSGPRKRGVGLSFFSNKLKPGRRFKKGLGMRNIGGGNIKKHIQDPFREIVEGEFQSTEPVSLGRLAESECLSIAKLLYSKVSKTKSHPANLQILAIARSSCCRTTFHASLEKKFGVMPERLFLKAAKLCSEHSIVVEWHQEGYICPKGCKLTATYNSHELPSLKSLPEVSHRPVTLPEPVTSEWLMDESHYVINFSNPKLEASERGIVLCDDISFGKESVQIACVVDEHLLGLLHNDDGPTNACFLPWESFTYATKPLLDQSLDIKSQSLQLGCGCAYSTCSPKTCDHVYLFDTDFEDAKDINGKSMKGRFPYDDNGRIILEEGYLVYECNNNCGCNKYCPNRVLQNGVRVKLEIFKTEEKGWAVRAGERIERGTFVCEYIGEVIDEQEANKRRQRYGKEGCSFIYEIDACVNDMIRLIEGEVTYAIDATKHGNISRYINHSCSPNLEIHQVLIESLDSQMSHIGLYANQDIEVGEELCFDYMKKAQIGEGCQCKCGAENCRSRVQ